MEPITMALIGAGLGLAKSELVDRPREQRQRKAAAEIARWSPWTGMAPGRVQEADPFGSTLQGGLTGAMLGQQFGGKDAAEAASASTALTPEEQTMTRPWWMDQQQPLQSSASSPWLYYSK